MNTPKASSLNSLIESDHGSNDSLLAESLQLDIEELNDAEYAIPSVHTMPTLESVLNDLDENFDDLSDAEFFNTGSGSTHSFDNYQNSSILKHVLLQGVTTQLKSASERVNAGNASSVAINHRIAVGTSHGHILCFDLTQTLKWCCQTYSSQGAVSALSFNDDSSRLLAGYAHGLIIMIETVKGNVIRTLSDVVTPNTGILHLKWTEWPALALCSDSGGSVWCLNFTRRLGVRGCQSRCLFSGARGEVCTFEPLMLNGEEHPLKSCSIVALATLSKFFVVMVRPRLKVIKFHILTGPGDCLPLLAWQMVLIQAADSTRTIDPVLAIGRGNQIYFHQLCFKQGRMNLLFLRKVVVEYNLLSLHWIGPKSILCLDTSENLHLVEVRTSNELENIDIGEIGLVYASAQFKGLATGGNVSPALALAGGNACYNSIVSTETELFILGAKSLHSITVRAWIDRISYLSNQQRWKDAFKLCIDIYRSISDRPKRQKTVKEKFLKLFSEYISSTQNSPDLNLSSVMECIIEINETELLWGELWDRLTVKNVFLCILTENIENDKLKIISPVVSQHLINYWEKVCVKKLDDIILKLNWECLDLHQVLTIAKKHKLYKSQMHLNTKALGDYTISLTELIPFVLEEDPLLGNNILVYISSSLAGLGYPTGDIPADISSSVKYEILRCLTAVHSSCATDSELPYPYLRILLNFNTRETLNVLSLAFQAHEFDGELGQSHRQRIVNILLEIITPETSSRNQVACLLNFISQQISLKNLPEDESLLNRILQYLSMENVEEETNREHWEREQAWLELITSDSLTHIPLATIIELCEKSKCFKVLEYLYEKTKQYDRILNCFVSDSSRHGDIFNYIKRFIKHPERKIYEQIQQHFTTIFDINHSELVNLLIENYPNSIMEFYKLLEDNSEKSFLFLEALYKSSNNLLNELKLSEEFLELMCKFKSENVQIYLKQHENYKIELALDLCKKYKLIPSLIYLYEKKGDFDNALNLSIETLNNSLDDQSNIETMILDIVGVCLRASDVLTDSDKEILWFKLLNFILENCSIEPNVMKNILHLASHHVNLQNLIQVIFNTNSNIDNRNKFGDIKHLIVGMLISSKFEIVLLEKTCKIFGFDLHHLLAKEKKRSCKGIYTKSIKCVICRIKLYENNLNNSKVIVFGSCGHSVHDNCVKNENECPRCGAVVKDRLELNNPCIYVINSKSRENDTEENDGILNVEAPPRQTIGTYTN